MDKQILLTRFVYLAAIAFILSGCAHLRPETNPLLDRKAFLLADQARLFNSHILTGKGSGWAKLQTKTKVTRYKIAWAAVFPDKIRLTFIISGFPVETIITTGEKVTFFSHTGEHTKYSYPSQDPDMEDYIQVPVKMSEVISILLGRLPVKRFDDAYFSPQDSSLSTIILKQKFKTTTQSLYINSNGKTDRLVNSSGAEDLLYEMIIKKYKPYGPGDIPVEIEIKDKNGRKLTLEIRNFQPNPPIKDALFELTESG